jgi:hypothetical protein
MESWHQTRGLPSHVMQSRRLTNCGQLPVISNCPFKLMMNLLGSLKLLLIVISLSDVAMQLPKVCL